MNDLDMTMYLYKWIVYSEIKYKFASLDVQFCFPILVVSSFTEEQFSFYPTTAFNLGGEAHAGGRAV